MAATHASSTAAARPPQRQPRRSVNRIIPAVPHRFSRPPAARPITPEDSAPVTQRASEPVPAAKSAKPDPTPAIETPLTPDSRLSPVEDRNGDPYGDPNALASSPALEGHVHVEEAPHTQGIFCQAVFWHHRVTMC